MLNNTNFIAQHQRVVAAASKAQLTQFHKVNLTGHTPQECISHLVGAYITYLVDYAKSVTHEACNLYLSHAVGSLIALKQYITDVSGHAVMWTSICDIDSIDDVTASIIDERLADLSRMHPVAFVGYAMTCFDSTINDAQDADYWASLQFELLSQYAYTRDIDLCKLITGLQ